MFFIIQHFHGLIGNAVGWCSDSSLVAIKLDLFQDGFVVKGAKGCCHGGNKLCAVLDGVVGPIVPFGCFLLVMLELFGCFVTHSQAAASLVKKMQETNLGKHTG